MTDKPHFRAQHGSKPVPVSDGLQNLVSNMGTNRDKRTSNRFTYNVGSQDLQQLEAAYQSNWIAQQIVNVPVDDGLREWRTWSCEDAETIRREEKRLRVQHNYRLARYWARLYGGAVVLMVTDQPLDQPLDVERIGAGSLKRLVVLDRWDVYPQSMNYTNPLREDYLMPEYYSIRSTGTQWIHSSHMVRVDGDELPRRLRAWNESWGQSTLARVLEDLQDVTATKNGIATMVQESNVDTISRQGLSNELASDQETQIMQRYALAGQMKSLVNMMLLDGDSETLERNQLTFSGLGDILDKLMIWVSGAADIPMTRLFGQGAAGLNATGEGDMHNYYDAVGSMQEAQFRPDLESLDEVLVRSALGDMPDDAVWNWDPLYQESGTELAQQDLAQAQTDDIRLQQGVVKPSHVMKRLQGDDKYSLTDEDVERAQRIEREDAEGFADPDEG